MKTLAFLFLGILSFNLMAEQKSTLVKYFDCASSTNIVSDYLPVFTKIDGKKIASPYRAGSYTRGMNISITTDAADEITKIFLGDKLALSVKDFESGLQFGVGPLTAHTIQLVDFRPESGGILQFGFLTKFSAKKKESVYFSKQNLNKFFNSQYGADWKTHNVYLARNPVSNQWEIQNKAGTKISAIYGIMDMKYDLLVFGITEMLNVTVKNSELLYNPNSITTLKKGDKTYKCEI